jgi:hypothetical protein
VETSVLIAEPGGERREGPVSGYGREREWAANRCCRVQRFVHGNSFRALASRSNGRSVSLSREAVSQTPGLSGGFKKLLGMAQNFIECDREQLLLMSPSLREWLPEDHLAWFVIDAVGDMDLSAFHARYRQDGWGRAAYDPAMMVAIVLYAYAKGQRSSRGIERACVEDVAYRVIASPGDDRAGVRTNQVQPSHRSLPTPRKSRRNVGMAANHRNTQLTEAPQAPDSSRRDLRGARKARPGRPAAPPPRPPRPLRARNAPRTPALPRARTFTKQPPPKGSVATAGDLAPAKDDVQARRLRGGTRLLRRRNAEVSGGEYFRFPLVEPSRASAKAAAIMPLGKCDLRLADRLPLLLGSRTRSTNGTHAWPQAMRSDQSDP